MADVDVDVGVGVDVEGLIGEAEGVFKRVKASCICDIKVKCSAVPSPD